MTLKRSPTYGFGFVAGSERPVIVRFVTEGGPSENYLLPADHILEVNGEDVKEAPRDHVIQLVRNCEETVTLVVCQPHLCTTVGRKSTLLSAGKKAKLKSKPIRVRFAESVCVNGAPLFPVSILFQTPFLLYIYNYYFAYNNKIFGYLRGIISTYRYI